MADCLGGSLPFVLDEIILHCGLGVQACFIIIIALIYKNEYACAMIFDKVSVKLKDGVTTPRHYSDYDISIDKDMPEGVTLIEKL